MVVGRKFEGHLLGIGVLLAFILPHTSTALLLVNPILCVIFKLVDRESGKRPIFLYYVMLPIFVSFIINILQIDIKAMMTCVSLLLYLFLFPFCGCKKVSNFYLSLTLLIIFISQIAYILDVPVITWLLDSFYPISTSYEGLIGHMQSNINADNMLNYRLGGLYRNPNQCARAISVLLAAYVVFNHERPIKKNLIFILLAYYAIVITGSRTGTVVASAIVITYLFQNESISSIMRYMMLLIIFCVMLYLFFMNSEMLRGFNVVQSFNDSGNLKWETFKYYLSTEQSPLRFLLGYADASRYDPPFMYLKIFDSEYGNLIYCYGFVGFIGAILFYCKLYKSMNRTGRIFLWLLLWMISSSILMAYRSCFYFLLLLSVVYNGHQTPRLSH